MGGSRGGYFSGSHLPDELVRRTRLAEDVARTDAFDTEVSGFLGSLLTQFNDRDTDLTRRTIEKVRSELEIDTDGSIDVLFGGSVAKHTYVDGISDVDALLLVDRTDLADLRPSQLISIVADTLGSHYGSDAVHEGSLAVTVDVGGSTVQFLPALRRGDGFAISSGREDTWSQINPQRFARALTDANRHLDGKLIPCIKLVKGIVARLPEQRRMTGYHVEAVAIKVFRRYDGAHTTKAMLRHFFEHAGSHVIHHIRDSSGQSVHVDEYLGSEGSLPRRIVADALTRVGRQMRNADGARSMDRWKHLFD